jgi:hypothetical protein
MSMKRFDYVTGTVPTTGGSGVVWDDGTTVYRETVNGIAGDTITGNINDLTNLYAGLPGYSLTYQNAGAG